MGDMRIMLVDDNGDLRRGMRDYLARQEGMKVVAECPSGAEALEALGKVRVDVMVLDLIMPQMDGFALMEEVRRQQLANPRRLSLYRRWGATISSCARCSWAHGSTWSSRLTWRHWRRASGKAAGRALCRWERR